MHIKMVRVGVLIGLLLGTQLMLEGTAMRMVAAHQVQEERELLSPVARVSQVSGQVVHHNAGDGADEWYEATINLAVIEGDQICTGKDGRAEIQTDEGGIVRLSSDTFIHLSALTSTVMRIKLTNGTATFRTNWASQIVRDKTLDSPAKMIQFEISTPEIVVKLGGNGTYRVDVDESGQTELTVRSGQAEVSRPDIGTLLVGAGRRFLIEGSGSNKYTVTGANNLDAWDLWNERRDNDGAHAWNVKVDNIPQGIPSSLPGLHDLDRYGEWINTAEFGRVWSPKYVGVTWAPYRLGYWRWFSVFGWTWVSHEPWGWLPYHYGRWAWHRKRWCWVPFGNGVILARPSDIWRWSPHRVAFFGWASGGNSYLRVTSHSTRGNSYSKGYRDEFRDRKVSVIHDGRGWLGWSPLAPGEVGQNWSPGSNWSPRNYMSPGGTSLLESRRFFENRVVRVDESLTAPIRSGQSDGPLPMRPIRVQEIQPPHERSSSQSVLVLQPDIQKRINSARTQVIRDNWRPTVMGPVNSSQVKSQSVTDQNRWRPSIEGGYFVNPSRKSYPITWAPPRDLNKGILGRDTIVPRSAQHIESRKAGQPTGRPTRVTVPSRSTQLAPAESTRLVAPLRPASPLSTGTVPSRHSSPARSQSVTIPERVQTRSPYPPPRR